MKEILDDYFEYNCLDSEFSDAEVQKNLNSLNKQFSGLTKNWNSELNSQWVTRDYIAVKMILSSSILLSSVKYANSKNLKIVEPYLIYYSLLNCARAVILTSPFSDWNNGEIFVMTHKKTINVVGDIISKYNLKRGQEIKKQIDWAREYREIFSYKFPANGLTKHPLTLENTIEICKLLCEIAQLQSKVLENSVSKNVRTEFDLDMGVLSIGYKYGNDNFQFIDNEDGYRVDYIIRKQKKPYSLHLTMTEGMVMDFFGAWAPKDDSDTDLYNPDNNFQIIFPCP